jgi:glucose-6-phosphate 1-epimerase
MDSAQPSSQGAPSARQFDIPGALRLETAPGGLVRAILSTSAAEAEIFLQGAHLVQWIPRGQQPVLFLSPRSLFAGGKAIRGGVPIIFPWFGARSDGKPGPAHGFARTSDWSVEETQLREDGRLEIALVLQPNDAARNFGYAAFHLQYRVTIGPELKLELETRNDGTQPLVYEEALHSYFRVADIKRAFVSGLEGTTYIDKTDGFKRKAQGNQAMRIAKESDQVHLNTKAACFIDDPVSNRRIIIEKSGSDSTVVWNPWIEKSESMSDMAPDDWKEMLCIETANAADNAVHLSPGASHVLAVSIRVEWL